MTSRSQSEHATATLPLELHKIQSKYPLTIIKIKINDLLHQKLYPEFQL